jgi:hypothetical protein
MRNWVEADTLPALRLERRVRILQSDFNALVARSYPGHTSQADPDNGPATR